jgi:hypothetical protein
MRKIVLFFIVFYCASSSAAGLELGSTIKIDLFNYDVQCETDIVHITGKIISGDRIGYEVENTCIIDGERQLTKMLVSDEEILEKVFP